jgi:Acetyltransferase (GNAT) domain
MTSTPSSTWASGRSLRALWSVIASHSSTASAVSLCTAPNDPFWWLTRERDATIVKRSMWMLRVVDAPAAVAARGFPEALTVGARGLSALYAGAPVSTLKLAGQAAGGPPDADAALDAAFAATPFMVDEF